MIKLQQVQRFLSSKQGTWLALIVAGLFILLILWRIYSAVAFLVIKPKVYSHVEPGSGFTKIIRKPQVNLSSLNIFGKYEAPQENLKNLPETNLNLHLDGVFVAVPEYLSQAVISVPGGEQKVFYVGDTVPGDAKLYRVLDN